MAAISGQNHRRTGPGRRFQAGQSGNPAGKPKGTRHRLTLLAEQLMAEDAEAVVRQVIEAAKGGDIAAARLILDRIVPVRKGRPVEIALPRISTVDDVSSSIGAVARAMGRGELTPDEAASVTAVLESHRKTLELSEIEHRIARLERASEAK